MRAVIFSFVIFLFGNLSLRAGEISGTVSFSSAKSSSKKASVRYAGQTGAKADKPAPAQAIVYLSGQFSEAQLKAARQKKGAAVVGQKNFRFTPNVLAVIKGTTVSFPNHDDAYHNVFSYSKAKKFDLGRYKKSEKAPTVTFDQAGVVRLFCEIHKHMRGTVLVLETPYFTKTTSGGKFSLKGLPAGKYELVAWANGKVVSRKKVTVTASSKQIVELSGS